MKIIFLVICLTFSYSCAQLYHVQIGEIDTKAKGKDFTILVSEQGFNIDEAGNIAKALSSKSNSEEVEDLKNLIKLFQMGPKTGNPVFNENYAENILEKISEHCPSGKITNLVAIREAKKYPVISGEIVKVMGTCLT